MNPTLLNQLEEYKKRKHQRYVEEEKDTEEGENQVEIPIVAEKV